MELHIITTGKPYNVGHHWARGVLKEVYLT